MRRFFSSSAVRRLPSNFTETLNLPKTSMPTRSIRDLEKEKEVRERITTELYNWQSKALPKEDTFVLHDGPPYANGDLHMGHALNKILKDITLRTQIAKSTRVSYIPGWDCHGLPIELKALQNLYTQDSTSTDGKGKGITATQVMQKAEGMKPEEIRQVARELAEETVKKQMDGFKSWGVMGDWEGRWKTMDKEYEIRQLEVFKRMVEKGLIYRRFKPVYWSPSSKTALAEAELEYNEKHTSKSAFVRFRVSNLGKRLSQIEGLDTTNTWLSIWTTTPWTILSNKAVALGPEMEYSVIKSEKWGSLVVASSRTDALIESVLSGEKVAIQATGIRGEELLDIKYRGPLREDDGERPVLSADFVTDDSGTGLVHCAPGHGMEDYLLCQKYGIDTFSPIDDEGRFTVEALPLSPAELEGQEALYAGNRTVLALLEKSENLLHIHTIQHKYPYDWRTKQPVMIRATAQWFADVSHIKSQAVNSLNYVDFIPEVGKQRLSNTVEGRSEWCISRQRAWGVPIPVVYNAETDEPLMTPENIQHIIEVYQNHPKGTEVWWDEGFDAEEFVRPQERKEGVKWKRKKETMDVWFDSGTSWATLRGRLGLEDKAETPVADMYLEGSDQHRGWFQSSLLTSIAATSTQVAPFKSVLTHGFVLDGNGRKMSKSIGNVIDPEDIIFGRFEQSPAPKKKKNSKIRAEAKPVVAEASGAGPDALRLWVSSCDYTSDVLLGPQVLQSVHHSLRKFRTAFRFLIGNLHDWDGVSVPYDERQVVDKFALEQLWEFHEKIVSAYDALEYMNVFRHLNHYTILRLSAFYFDVIKDRVYASAPNSLARRAAQSTLFDILALYLPTISPLAPFLAEEVFAHIPPKTHEALTHFYSAHSRTPPPYTLATQLPLPREIPAEWTSPPLRRDMTAILELGEHIKQALESARKANMLKVNLEARGWFEPDPTMETKVARHRLLSLFKRYGEDLNEVFILSGFKLGSPPEKGSTAEDVKWEVVNAIEFGGVRGVLTLRNAGAEKCPRCWMYTSEEEGKVCRRCEEVVGRDEGVE